MIPPLPLLGVESGFLGLIIISESFKLIAPRNRDSSFDYPVGLATLTVGLSISQSARTNSLNVFFGSGETGSL